MSKFSKLDLDVFKQAFDLFDKDGSGSISRQEIQVVFKELKINLNHQEIQKIMQNFDSNHDDSIQFEQFLAVISAHLEDPDCQDWIFQVFIILDKDCDGLVQKQQLMRVSQYYGLGITQKQLQLIMEEGDPANEGGICYEQFVKILKIK